MLEDVPARPVMPLPRAVTPGPRWGRDILGCARLHRELAEFSSKPWVAAQSRLSPSLPEGLLNVFGLCLFMYDFTVMSGENVKDAHSQVRGEWLLIQVPVWPPPSPPPG